MYSFIKTPFLVVATVLFSILLFSSTGSALAGGGKDCVGKSPLPKYKIEVPSADVPTKMATFSGVWNGIWWDTRRPGNGPCHTLVVENIEPDGTASVIYSTGKYRHWNIKNSYGRFKGKIDGDTLVITLGKGVVVSYRWSYGDIMGNYNYGKTFGRFLGAID